MYSFKKYQELKFEKDIYISRVRCNYPHLMTNLGYEGIQIIDSFSGSVIGEIKYPKFDFSIYTWVVSPDGGMSYLFSPDEEKYALELDLEKFKARKIDLSEDFQAPTQLCWFLPNLRIMDYKFRIWVLEKNALINIDEEATYYSKNYERTLKRFVVEKIDPYSDGLYVRSREFPVKRIGYLSLKSDKGYLMEHDGSAVDITHYQNSLFVAFKDKIIQFRDGEAREMLDIPKNESFISVNVLIHNNIGYLNVIFSSKDYLNTPISTVMVYELISA